MSLSYIASLLALNTISDSTGNCNEECRGEDIPEREILDASSGGETTLALKCLKSRL